MDPKRFVKILLAFAVTAALFMGAAATADDHEEPIEPDPGASGMVSFGKLSIQVEDVHGPSVDVMEAIEPVVSALLTMGELDGSEEAVISVSTAPVFHYSGP